jgi:hypothetical protein
MTMMTLATTTNTCMSTTAGMGVGAYGRPPASGSSRDVGVDADTRCMEAAAAAVAAARRTSGVQVRNRIKENKK